MDGRWPMDSRRCDRLCGSASVFISFPAPQSGRSMTRLCPCPAQAELPGGGSPALLASIDSDAAGVDADGTVDGVVQGEGCSLSPRSVLISGMASCVQVLKVGMQGVQTYMANEF